MTRIIVAAICFYKKLSRILVETRAPFYIHTNCKYYPSCSDFVIESITKHGILRGSARSALRILKCSPFFRGGVNNS